MAIDPGAFGTLVNGLRAVEAERRAYDAALGAEDSDTQGDVAAEPRPTRRLMPVRATLARALRGAADRLEPAC
jgi:hypothetical protein